METLRGYFSEKGREKRAVLRVMTNLHRDKTPFRMEVERFGLHFYSMLSLRRQVVVVAKPEAIGKFIRRGVRVRLRVPQKDRLEIGMEVISPDFRLLSGNRVFLCDIPSAFIVGAPRLADRFNTAQFKELRLFLRGIQKTFRIINMSTGGCRIYSEEKPDPEVFDPGYDLGPAKMGFGSKLALELDTVIPRYCNSSSVGLEIRISRRPRSLDFLKNFMRKLEFSEMERLRVEPL